MPPIGVTEIGPSFIAVIAAGTFINCQAGSNSFGVGAVDGRCTGIFTNCTASNQVFGYSTFSGGGGLASGTFTNCKAESYSFGGFGTASGTFRNCIGDAFSFGFNGNVSGIYENCVGGDSSWTNSILTGKLYFCRLTYAQSSPSPAPGGALVAFINGDNFTAQNP
jgi:hypothetical protein